MVYEDCQRRWQGIDQIDTSSDASSGAGRSLRRQITGIKFTVPESKSFMRARMESLQWNLFVLRWKDISTNWLLTVREVEFEFDLETETS